MARARANSKSATESVATDHRVTTFRRPILTQSKRIEFREAAAHAQRAHQSDPFTYNRVLTHMIQGIETVEAVTAEANQVINARHEHRSYVARKVS